MLFIAKIITISICSIASGSFLSMIIMAVKNNKNMSRIMGIISALIVGFCGILIINFGYKNDIAKYNDGICSQCETKWTLFDVEYSKNIKGEKTYYYKCENNHMIEIHNDIT